MQQIFGFPCFIKNIDKNLYNKEEIIKDIEHNYNKNKKRNVWDKGNINESNLHHIYNDWDNTDFKKINFDKLTPIYKEVFVEFLKNLKLKKQEIKFKFNIVNYTCLTSSQYMTSHAHADCDFSAVHYIKFDDTIHTATLFENNNDYSNFSKTLRPNLNEILDETCTLNSWYYKNFRFKIKEDDICIVPGLLSHSISKQLETKKTRITLVCNITLE
jgi:uncharacterized protein YfkK (UPF0435 family)